MLCRIKKIFKIIGIFLLAILLLIAILIFWLNSLGSTDDFSIKDYKAYVFVDPMNNMLNIDCDLTLQALEKKDRELKKVEEELKSKGALPTKTKI